MKNLSARGPTCGEEKVSVPYHGSHSLRGLVKMQVPGLHPPDSDLSGQGWGLRSSIPESPSVLLPGLTGFENH